jgi:hypothetical protein
VGTRARAACSCSGVVVASVAASCARSAGNVAMMSAVVATTRIRTANLGLTRRQSGYAWELITLPGPSLATPPECRYSDGSARRRPVGVAGVPVLRAAAAAEFNSSKMRTQLHSWGLERSGLSGG